MKDIEIRGLAYEDAEVRALANSRQIEGYGIVFNKVSRLIENRFYELILPSAMDGIIETNDVLVLMNHDLSRGVLARSTYGTGSLKLQIDGKGVKYSFEAPSFDLGNELVEGVRRGDIRDSSFGFTVTKDGMNIERRSDGTFLRTITKFDSVVDMSPCYRAAYVDTTVALRSLDEFENSTKDLTKEIDTKPIIAETIIEPIVEVPEKVMGDKERRLRRINNSFKI